MQPHLHISNLFYTHIYMILIPTVHHNIFTDFENIIGLHIKNMNKAFIYKLFLVNYLHF